MPKYQKGFTLVELAVVLAIIGIITSSLILSFSGQREAVKFADSQNRLVQIKKALLSFEMVNRYLPCPDTDANGFENRSNDHSCVSTYGTPPFQDLGLSLADVQDGYGVDIRYAVNQGTTTLANMQNIGHSASYFCNLDCKGTGNLPMFDLRTTPPVSGDLGVGNYTICNNDAASCTAGLASDNYLADGLSVVLVAYNANGAQLTTSCAGLASREVENCDVDLFYWDAIATKLSGSFFDDQVLGISGYEIKTELLKTDPTAFTSTLTPSNSNQPATPTPPPKPSNPDNTIIGDYNGKKGQGSILKKPNDASSLKIDGDVNKEIDLKKGDDELTITGDQNDKIEMGKGSDNLYIEGDAYDNIELEEGDDYLTILGSLTNDGSVDAGDGNDKVYIEGDAYDKIMLEEGNDELTILGSLKSGGEVDAGDDNDVVFVGVDIKGDIDLGSGDDELRVNGDIMNDIEGGEGTDVIYVNKTSFEWDASGQIDYLSGFEKIQFKDGTVQNLP